MGLSNYIPASSIARPGVCTSSTRPASPYEGQVIYETDTDRTLVWSGSAWVFLSTGTANPVGLELVKTQTVGTAVSSVTVNDVFSSTYDNYRIIYSGGSGSAAVADISFVLGGINSGYYGAAFGGTWNTSGAAARGMANVVSFTYAGSSDTGGALMSLDVFNPNKATRKYFRTDSYYSNTNEMFGIAQGTNGSTTQATSFTFSISSGTVTGGTVRVYGYRNSQ